MSLPTIWLQDYKSQEDRDQFTKTILNETNNIVLMKLKKIVKNKRLALEASERSTDIYDSASWAYKQAHTNGMRQALKNLEDLMTFVKDQN